MSAETRRVSQQGIDLIKRFEGFKAAPYYCPGGYLTIGYGHVIEEDEAFCSISEPDAAALLFRDVERYAQVIDKVVVRALLTQGRYDALVSLTYNWGAQNFLKSLGLKKLNLGDYEGAAIEFFSRDRSIVNIKGKFSQGLYNRRLAELELWNAPA